MTKNAVTLSASCANMYERMSSTITPTSATMNIGSIATIHSNNSRECLGRMEMMMLLSGFSIPQRAMRQQIASAINIIVHVARLGPERSSIRAGRLPTSAPNSTTRTITHRTSSNP